MKLKPVKSLPPVILKGRVPGELQIALSAYTAYYREKTGEAIEVWPLVVQMLQQFLATDHEFQAWRRRTQNGPSPGPAVGPKSEQEDERREERGDGRARY
jgi:hypothetical protein